MENLQPFLNMSIKKTALLEKFGAQEAGRTVIKGGQVGIIHLGKVRWLTQDEMMAIMNKPEKME